MQAESENNWEAKKIGIVYRFVGEWNGEVRTSWKCDSPFLPFICFDEYQNELLVPADWEIDEFCCVHLEDGMLVHGRVPVWNLIQVTWLALVDNHVSWVVLVQHMKWKVFSFGIFDGEQFQIYLIVRRTSNEHIKKIN